MNKLDKKNLFIDISEKNVLIVVGEYDEELNFKIIHKEITSPSGLQNGKIVDIEKVASCLKKTMKVIETKLNFVFKFANISVNQNDCECINVSGFKKLNGNQILSDDISFILNNIRSKLIEVEKDKKIIHLFNTKFVLDGKLIKNLPIGLSGDFYSHQLTFFLIQKNELKNISNLLNKCNLNLNKIVLKSFIEGINFINKENKNTFFLIKFYKNKTYLIHFKDSAYCFYQSFNFGSNIILKDISKVCSIELQMVQEIFLNEKFELSNEDFIDEKNFKNINFKKDSLKKISEIVSARIAEIADIILNKNKHLKNSQTKDIPFYFYIEDESIYLKLKKYFEKYFLINNFYSNCLHEKDPFSSLTIFGELLAKGWTREAIPFINKKKSWFSRFFAHFFD